MRLRIALIGFGVLVVAAGAAVWQYGQQVPDDSANRQRLLAELQPVALKNCELRRYGEPGDGGYLVCANLLRATESLYSYGISGYDKWGCDLSTDLQVPVHRYDCFNTTDPACPSGKPMFHAECVGPTQEVVDGRPFDSMENQVRKNGDADRRLVVKMDVEGAEWESFLATPKEVFDRIDQLIVEFHIRRVRSGVPFSQGVPVVDERFVLAMNKLKAMFHVANLHFNNYSCVQGFEPFPSYAFEVLFVNKRVAEVDSAARATFPNPLDMPNRPDAPDCQAVSSR